MNLHPEVWTASRCWERSGGAQRVYGPFPPLPSPYTSEYPGWNVPILAPMPQLASLAHEAVSRHDATRVRSFRIEYATYRDLRELINGELGPPYNFPRHRVWVEQ